MGGFPFFNNISGLKNYNTFKHFLFNNTKGAHYVSNNQGDFIYTLLIELLNNTKTTTPQHISIFVEDENIATEKYHILNNLSDKNNIFLLDKALELKSEFVTINDNQLNKKFNTYKKCFHSKANSIIVASVESMAEFIPITQQTDNNHEALIFDKSMTYDRLCTLLKKHKFIELDKVEKPGEYAIKGSIIDFFAYGLEKPLRAEFDFETLKSLRKFDRDSQFSEEEIIQNGITIHFFESLRQEKNIHYANLLQEIEAVDGKIIVFDEKYIKNAFDEYISKMKDYQFESDSAKQMINDSYPLAKYTDKNILYVEKKMESGKRIDFNQSHTIQHNRNFEYLFQAIHQYVSKNYNIYFFSTNLKQYERLIALLGEDNDIKIHHIPHSISKGFVSHDTNSVVLSENDVFGKYFINRPKDKKHASSKETLSSLTIGDYVTHMDFGIGVFAGLNTINIGDAEHEVVKIIFKDNDILYVNIHSLGKISKYTSKDSIKPPKVGKLRNKSWKTLKEKAQKSIKTLAFDLMKLYAERKNAIGFSHALNTLQLSEMEGSFLFEETPDQLNAINQIFEDMESQKPMDRLLCGDVGFGKTEVAMRAAFKAATNHKQVAILVPTTILAYQHYQTFSERLKPFHVSIDFLSRLKTTKEKNKTIEDINSGKCQIIIATHGLISDKILFHDLGLLIIDEEHKFGVNMKDKIKSLKKNIDCLSMSATPIPRTMQFSLMGVRDLSLISTPPPNRLPVHTELMSFKIQFIKKAIYEEIYKGGQVFFVQNRIAKLSDLKETLERACPDLDIRIAHGQMNSKYLEEILQDFIDKKFDVLVTTNIIESGIDISNVNTIFIQNAHYFGLSELHQLRGRVGRSGKQANCYLLVPSLHTLTKEAKQRLKVIENHTDLGSGYYIAMKDLDARGIGNIFGAEQSGFMEQIGVETYFKILEQTLNEINNQKTEGDVSEVNCSIDLDWNIKIPSTYIKNNNERLRFYTLLDNNFIKNKDSILDEMTDKYGKPPENVENLFILLECKELFKELGFSKVVQKKNTITIHFNANEEKKYFESNVFGKITKYSIEKTSKIKFFHLPKPGMRINDIHSIKDLHHFITKLKTFSLPANAI